MHGGIRGYGYAGDPIGGDKVDIGSLGRVPDNFTVRNRVPQIEVLKRADACICHGGLNSVSEALYHGVPVISNPQANDQPMVTRRVVENIYCGSEDKPY